MLLLIPGPVQTRPETRAAMSADIAPWDDDFRAEYAALRPRITAIAGGIEGRHATTPLQGCGHMIVEAAIRSFIPAGGKLLVPNNGAYGGRVVRLAREAGRIPVELKADPTRPIDPLAVAAALAADPAIGHVGLVHSETGTGIVNDAQAIGAVVRAAGRRMLLDAVSGFGVLPFTLAEQPEVDAVVFTSNKCLEGLPGFGFAVAPIERLLACEGQAGSWCLDLANIHRHALDSGAGSFRFTPPVQALRAFAVALDLYDRETRAARAARYAANARILYDGALQLGLTPYLAREQQGPIIVTLHQPRDPGFTLASLVNALKRRGVLISNFHTTPEPTLRIGCIGAVSNDDMHFAVTQLGSALDALGVGHRSAA